MSLCAPDVEKKIHVYSPKDTLYRASGKKMGYNFFLNTIISDYLRATSDLYFKNSNHTRDFYFKHLLSVK